MFHLYHCTNYCLCHFVLHRLCGEGDFCRLPYELVFKEGLRLFLRWYNFDKVRLRCFQICCCEKAALTSIKGIQYIRFSDAQNRSQHFSLITHSMHRCRLQSDWRYTMVWSKAPFCPECGRQNQCWPCGEKLFSNFHMNLKKLVVSITTRAEEKARSFHVNLRPTFCPWY